jgi:uncharacterized coiled-coil protein SlyX
MNLSSDNNANNAAASSARAKAASYRNIVARSDAPLVWDSGDVAESLTQLCNYVTEEACRTEQWYWARKSPKAFLSRAIQLLAVTLTALGGIFPILVKMQLFPGFSNYLRSAGVIGAIEPGLWSSFFIGSAAALVGLDRMFGFSSGWARYVLTGTTIRRTIEEFRLDWTSLLAESSQTPTPAQSLALIGRAKQFRMAVEGMVLKETQDWVTEFQNNIAQLEKDLRVQVDNLKAAADQTSAAQAAAGMPGSLEATITNAEKSDDFHIDATLENGESSVAQESVTNSKTWVKLLLPPGQYKLTVNARTAGKPVSAACAVFIKPSEVAKPVITLPIA